MFQLHRETTEVGRLSQSTGRQKLSLETKERQISSMEEKERQSNNRILALQSQLKIATDECKRLSFYSTERENRYTHETKRMNNELSRLKEKLSKVLGEKTSLIHGNNENAGSSSKSKL